MASPYLVISFIIGGVTFAILVVASIDASVCSNKINTPLHLADPLPSSPLLLHLTAAGICFASIQNHRLLTVNFRQPRVLVIHWFRL
jgi:hypothetical protein